MTLFACSKRSLPFGRLLFAMMTEARKFLLKPVVNLRFLRVRSLLCRTHFAGDIATLITDPVVARGFHNSRADDVGAFGSTPVTEDDLPTTVVLVVATALTAQTPVDVTLRVALQQVVIRIWFELPRGILIWDVNAKREHLVLKYLLVIAQRALEEMYARVNRLSLHAVAMEPSVLAAGCTQRAV